MQITRDVFDVWREPRVGTDNPTRLDNPLWASLVHDPVNAYAVNQRFAYERAYGAGPTWCFDRFGRSTTLLPDGRTIQIAGEHEDYYDPDFYIYNDVVVLSPTGDVAAIYGYPRDAFPPTDFHTATLDGARIWIVGNLGYPQDRKSGVTQVCRLDLATMAIAPVATTGDAPGWLHRHTADLRDGALVVRGGKVSVENSLDENIDVWSLDLASRVWTRRTRLPWQRWTVRRADARRSLLWELRQVQWSAAHPEFERSTDYRHMVAKETGHLPDLEGLRTLYLCDGAVETPAVEGDDHNIFRITLDGVLVRFVEAHDRITVMVEGQLAEDRLHALQQHVLARVSALHATTWTLVG